MTGVKSSDLQALVTDAVVDLLRGRAIRSEERAPATVRIPLQVASQDDLTALVRWLRKLCASDALRKQFVRGDIGLDIQWVAPAKAVAAAGAAPRPDRARALGRPFAALALARCRGPRAAGGRSGQFPPLQCGGSGFL